MMEEGLQLRLVGHHYRHSASESCYCYTERAICVWTRWDLLSHWKLQVRLQAVSYCMVAGRTNRAMGGWKSDLSRGVIVALWDE